jgi:hypothetical protein
MKTKKIELAPKKKKGYGQRRMNVYYLSKVAWNFAHALLWSEHEFTDDEIREVKEHLINYFGEASHRKKALISFCERIILTEKYNAAKGRVTPAPSVWFNPKYHQGFAETKSWYHCIEDKRKEIPGYLKHYTVLANHYYLYALQPSNGILSQCREKLLALKAKTLLQHFYKTIYHFNYINQ